MKYSIILTIHNKENLIERVLDGIVKNTTGDYELIIVLDGCTDKSKEIVEQFILGRDIPIQVIETPNVFESKANTEGIKISSGDIIILCQDDSIIDEYSWNEKLSKPILLWGDIWAVSGNNAHEWSINPHSKHIHFDIITNDNWSDILIHHSWANTLDKDPNKFVIRSSCNRSPLALRRDIMEKIGYFNKDIYRQDLDDAYAMFEVYEKFGLKCGYLPIKKIEELSWGGTRDQNGTTKSWLLECNQRNAKLFYNRFKERLEKNINYNEIRNING